ncbi:predicted protein [Mycobacterium tuberculosis T17]|nr:predicted protein [Mycobacterium tuberculosis T17]
MRTRFAVCQTVFTASRPPDSIAGVEPLPRLLGFLAYPPQPDAHRDESAGLDRGDPGQDVDRDLQRRVVGPMG